MEPPRWQPGDWETMQLDPPDPTSLTVTASTADCTVDNSRAVLDALRSLRAADPHAGVKALVSKLRDQQPELAAGAREVRAALRTLEAESGASADDEWPPSPADAKWRMLVSTSDIIRDPPFDPDAHQPFDTEMIDGTRAMSWHSATFNRTNQAEVIQGTSGLVSDMLGDSPEGPVTGRNDFFGAMILDPKNDKTIVPKKSLVDFYHQHSASAVGSSTDLPDAPTMPVEGEESGSSDDEDEDEADEDDDDRQTKRVVLPPGALRCKFKCGGEFGGCPGCLECIEDHPAKARRAARVTPFALPRARFAVRLSRDAHARH